MDDEQVQQRPLPTCPPFLTSNFLPQSPRPSAPCPLVPLPPQALGHHLPPLRAHAGPPVALAAAALERRRLQGQRAPRQRRAADRCAQDVAARLGPPPRTGDRRVAATRRGRRGRWQRGKGAAEASGCIRSAWEPGGQEALGATRRSDELRGEFGPVPRLADGCGKGRASAETDESPRSGENADGATLNH